MSTRQATPERMGALSDGVFAIIITILVLDLKPPEASSFGALLSLWPRGIGYAVSYLFLAIVWGNHHYLMRYASLATHRLVWGNFAHLFAVSLAVLHGLDRSNKVGCGSGCGLCSRLHACECDLPDAMSGGRG